MTTQTLTLTEFLLAQIAEDEEEVRGYVADLDAHPPSAYDMEQVGWIEAGSPARVLAECEAKRRIVEEARNYSPELSEGDNGEWALNMVLANFAAVYADHEDYREEWKA